MKWKACLFTLVELLISIAIIAILCALLLPALNKAREAGKKASCASNVKQLSMTVLFYVNDNNDYLPLRDIWYQFITDKLPYTDETVPKIFCCPAQQKPTWNYQSFHYGFNENIVSGYDFTSLTPHRLSQCKRPSQIIQLADGDGDGDGDYVINAGYWMIGNFHAGPTPVGYLDGHTSDQWRSRISRANMQCLVVWRELVLGQLIWKKSGVRVPGLVNKYHYCTIY